MEILPQLQSTLNFIVFMANLIDLKQFNTILVVHDQANRNQINFLIENLQSRYDVTWMLVNEYENPHYWTHAIIKHEKLLILTTMQDENIYSHLMSLYNRKYLNAATKNIIISSDITNRSIKTLQTVHYELINSVFVDWRLDMIYAWNPYSGGQIIGLNETEFLASHAYCLDGKYSGIFFGQLHSMKGATTVVTTIYDAKNMYNVIAKGSVAGVDGAVIRIVDLIGGTIQSHLEYWVTKLSAMRSTISKDFVTGFLERTYRTFVPVPMREVNIVTFKEMSR